MTDQRFSTPHIVPRVLGFPAQVHPSETPEIDDFAIRMAVGSIYRDKAAADQRAAATVCA